MYNSISSSHLSEVLNSTHLIPNTTAWLQQAATRSRGLQTLQYLLLENIANNEILTEKGSGWMMSCVTALKAPKDQALAYNNIRLLLEKFSTVHELDRTVLNHLPELTSALTNCSPPFYIHALKCLETLLSKFPKAAGGHKSKIEKFIVKFMYSKNKRDVLWAAKCAQLLQQVRGGGEQGTNHKLAWRHQFDLLIDASNNILSTLYPNSFDTAGQQSNQNSEETNSSSLGPLQTVLKEIDESVDEDDTEGENNPVTQKTIRLAVKLENLLVFIQSMLVDPFPVSKRVNCHSILSLLMRCQTGACGTPSPGLIEPSLNQAVCDTLRALIFSLKGNMLPYSFLMMRMALQTLEWSKTKGQAGTKPFKCVRKSAYTLLSTILCCVRTIRLPTQQGEQSYEDKIFENMLSDIVPQKIAIQLTVKSNSNGPVKAMSKKAKRKMTMSQLESSSIASHSPYASNYKSDPEHLDSDVTVSALQCMDLLFTASGNFFKTTTYQSVQETLIRMLYEVNSRGVAVKKALMHTLMIVQQNSPTSHPSPIAHCLNLFSLGQNSSNFELSALARLALNTSLSSVRGAAPPILIPKPAQQTISTAKDRLKSSQQKKFMNFLDQGKINERLTNGDVIILGDEDSVASEEDNEIGNSKSCNTGQHKDNPAVISSLPENPKIISIDDDETQEICVSSDNETTKPTESAIVIDENLSDDVEFMEIDTPNNSILKQNGTDSNLYNEVSNDEIRFYRHELSKNASACSDKDSSKESDTNSGNETVIENSCTNVDFLKDARKIDINNIQNASRRVSELQVTEDELKAKENVLNASKNVSIEEMLGSFVDEVKENLK